MPIGSFFFFIFEKFTNISDIFMFVEEKKTQRRQYRFCFVFLWSDKKRFIFSNLDSIFSTLASAGLGW